MRRLASIQCSSQLSQRRKAVRLPRVRELPWLIARSRLGLLQPLDRLVELPLLDEVGPDVVVRVAEGLVDSDRLLTLVDCLVQATLKAVGPAVPPQSQLIRWQFGWQSACHVPLVCRGALAWIVPSCRR